MNNDSRNLRQGQSSMVSGLDRAIGDDIPSGDHMVLKTVADPGGNPYPAVASRYYPVKRQSLGGDETAGATLTLTEQGGTFYAGNLGTAVPPLGTGGLIGTLIDGVICFRYNG